MQEISHSMLRKKKVRLALASKYNGLDGCVEYIAVRTFTLSGVLVAIVFSMCNRINIILVRI